MKKFIGERTLEDKIWMAKNKGFDYQEIDFKNILKKDDLYVVLRSFGKFLVYKDDKCIASENSEELDGEKWYQEILDIIYKFQIEGE